MKTNHIISNFLVANGILLLGCIIHLIQVKVFGITTTSYGDICAFILIVFVAPIIRKYLLDGDMW